MEASERLLDAEGGRVSVVRELLPFATLQPFFEGQYRDAVALGRAVDEVWVVMFHTPESRSSELRRWERWAIGRYCRGITHIELVFRNASGDATACTIDRPEPERHPESGVVRMFTPDPRRSYAPEYWTQRVLSSMTGAERHALLWFCGRQLGKPFNYGMYWNFVPLIGGMLAGTSLPEEDSYFCSQLVACALQWIRPEQFARVDARRCTPVVLYDILERCGDMRIAGSMRPVDMLQL